MNKNHTIVRIHGLLNSFGLGLGLGPIETFVKWDQRHIAPVVFETKLQKLSPN